MISNTDMADSWANNFIDRKRILGELYITSLTSNKRKWNNYFMKFGTLLYLEIIAKFYWFLRLQNDRKFMGQKQQQVGSHMACASFANLVEWEIWKRSKRVCRTKITIMYNLRNVCETKDIQPWSQSLRRAHVLVNEKSCDCALTYYSCKSWSSCERRCVKIILDKNSIRVPLLWLP